jgi:hypothetical protein
MNHFVICKHAGRTTDDNTHFFITNDALTEKQQLSFLLQSSVVVSVAVFESMAPCVCWLGILVAIASSLQSGAEDITTTAEEAVIFGDAGHKTTTPVFEKEGNYSHNFQRMMKNAKGLEMVLQVHIAKVKSKG